MSEGLKASTTTFWHPYTDDSPEARIRMDCVDPVAFLRKRIGRTPTLVEAGLFRRAAEDRKPFNDPTLGCLVHEPN